MNLALMILESNMSSVPDVTDAELSGRINGMFDALYNMLDGSFYNFATIVLVIAIICFIGTIIFHMKTAMKFLIGIIGILGGIFIFHNAKLIIGFFKHIVGF